MGDPERRGPSPTGSQIPEHLAGDRAVDQVGLDGLEVEEVANLLADNPYLAAEAIFNARVEQLKEAGELRRLPEIRDEAELDDHFDQLARLYREACVELDLPWPPIPIEDASEEEGTKRVETARGEEPGLEPPTIEQLMEWEWDGGCEAACPEGCWVEPDGRCEHGKDSWLIVLGLI
jgi:hypothetical protein